MNILFACGGTAGHINPAVALARLFQERNEGCRILFVGADGGMETRLVPKEGYDIQTVTITNFRRSLLPEDIVHNMRTLVNMRKSKKQSEAILDQFRPDLAVGTGGYASYPIISAAARRGIPTAVHESNAVPGLTTKALSKVVDQVLVGFEESRSHYDHPEKVVVTGTPVRGDFFRYTRQEAREQLGLTDDRPLVVSVWGSLGAAAMNRQTVDLIAEECRQGEPFHHIHSAGRDYAHVLELLAARAVDLKAHPSIDVREYIYDMPLVMAAADLVLCRAGASTISELSALAKPSVLVPSPNVVADHQTKNARVLSQAGGAVLLPEAESSGEKLYETVAGLLADQKKREAMSAALRRMSVPDAGEQIYQVLLGLMKGGKSAH
ncbi:undecaprenyldiphospho-muramoylpentapeptide beta-N-acetylglucosaminyltransferase [Pseudoflavonifractor phocaeensis]|uniref:undecaprenyldiphospho-muramoylpentapeptide beta-N-acetylglucosaminyltransferase n=1 Tax=Pseudoflavonifractor phocaeensis TaxID=1870988 RepID=UPI00195EBEEA|nr:undecaprenyldiphospho-muramoylpentapeptide beta-N-acetylglucosaminyltransferase [Pseudoflavonifractor phocaeensis]MBM6869400.1 undecaprenyldiphospho-muramoylpentapeptide beta-N-acetylglucosaminyltransferase [Pseudoflavonifractor phocaeensis]